MGVGEGAFQGQGTVSAPQDALSCSSDFQLPN